MDLSQDQQTALSKFVEFIESSSINEMALEGHSGSGKTTLIPYLLEAADNNVKLKNLLGIGVEPIKVISTATTNKAAKILSEKTGLETFTIHKALGLKVTNNFADGTTYLKKTKDYRILENTLLIIDESSMIDEKLLTIIREACMRCKILFVGDPYQLAPVFSNDCPAFNTVEFKAVLRTIMRQSDNSDIPVLGEKFRQTVDTGEFPLITEGAGIELVDGDKFRELIEAEFLRDGRGEFCAKVLCWTNDRVTQYNNHIRGLTTNSKEFIVGEYVVTNNPIPTTTFTVATETILEVTAILEDTVFFNVQGRYVQLNNSIKVFLPHKQNDVKKELKALAKAKEWVPYFALKEGCADLRPIHSSTVHKSQGSTYRTTFIDLSDIGRNNKPLEVARLLYVAITRSSEKVVFYGSLPEKYTK